MDTIALALVVLNYEAGLAHSILDEVLDYVDEEGLVQVSPALLTLIMASH
jgi:hypothetical protein